MLRAGIANVLQYVTTMYRPILFTLNMREPLNRMEDPSCYIYRYLVYCENNLGKNEKKLMLNFSLDYYPSYRLNTTTLCY